MDNHSRDRAEQVALFRFSVISEAVSPRLSPAERGVIVRALAARTWTTPEGVERSFARVTIDRWVVAYRRDWPVCGLRHAPIGAGPGPWAAGWKKQRGCAGRCRPGRRLRSWTASPGRMGWCCRSGRCERTCAGRD